MPRKQVWAVAPEDQGKIVERSWIGAGPHGAIERHIDRNSGEVSYFIHEWTDGDVEFDPWNGSPVGVSVEKYGDPISEHQVNRLLCDAYGDD